jgi:hypothetical protein
MITKRNMGAVDRLTRALVAAPVLIVLGFALGTASLVGVAAFVLATVMLATAAAGFCPAYVPFGISTRSWRTARAAAPKG